jgi:hypothetical protein
MSEPIRDGQSVYQESVDAARQAVQQAIAANAQQQGEAERWMTGGFPADPQAHTPGPHQHS